MRFHVEQWRALALAAGLLAGPAGAEWVKFAGPDVELRGWLESPTRQRPVSRHRADARLQRPRGTGRSPHRQLPLLGRALAGGGLRGISRGQLRATWRARDLHPGAARRFPSHGPSAGRPPCAPMAGRTSGRPSRPESSDGMVQRRHGGAPCRRPSRGTRRARLPLCRRLLPGLPFVACGRCACRHSHAGPGRRGRRLDAGTRMRGLGRAPAGRRSAGRDHRL